MKITRKEMISAVKKNIKARSTRIQQLVQKNKLKSFEMEGQRSRLSAAESLFERLRRGDNPTTKEVVGYFGKGARFAE